MSRDALEQDFRAQGWPAGVPWNGRPRVLPLSFASSGPHARANPFRPGPPLDLWQLPGREPILTELIESLEQGTGLTLLGPRRSGKTSVLNTLQRRLADTCHVVCVSLEGKPRHLRSQAEFLELIEPECGGDPDRYERALRARARTVYLIDELGYLAAADSQVVSLLRSISQRSDNDVRVGFVLAGTDMDWHRVMHAARKTHGSSFGNDLPRVGLPALSHEAALEFVRETGSRTQEPDLPWTRIAEVIVDLCGTWPFYLQAMGHALVQGVRAGRLRPPIQAPALKELHDEVLLRDFDHGFANRFTELRPRARSWLVEDLRERHDGDPPGEPPNPVRDDTIHARLYDGLTKRWIEDPPFMRWIQLRGPDHLDDKEH
jgi:hypothetical protein